MFEEPTAAYFADFQDVALHVVSGHTIRGYLNLEPVDVRPGGAMPDVRIDNAPEFQCSRVDWDAARVRNGDELEIRSSRWVVKETPREPVVVRVRLGRPVRRE